MQSPLLAVVNTCVETITRLSREFGLTPAARSRIIAQSEPEEEEDLMAILSRRGRPANRPTASRR